MTAVLEPSVSREPAPATLARWRRDPVAFVRENFGVEPDLWQQDVLMEFVDPDIPRMSLQACVGPGKSAVLAWCSWLFLSCYADTGEHPKGAVVAITRDNLRDNLWAEMAKWQDRSPYLAGAFTWSAERIYANGHAADWFLAARSWPKSASPDEQGKTLSGLHGKFVLAVVDESGGIPVTVLRAAEQALSTRPLFGKILQAGNPISLDGMLYAAAAPLRHQWSVTKITGDPDDPKRSPRIDKAWAQEQIDAYGRENPWIKSQLLGEFPPASINALLGVDEVEAAMARHLREPEYEWAQKRLGVDVARFGDDRTVIFPRQGLAAFRPQVLRHERTTAIAARVATAVQTWKSEVQAIDDTGHWGHGVIDNLLAARIPGVIGVQFHAPALDRRYRNRRAEMWLTMAEWVKRGAALPPMQEMVGELVTPTYTFVNGKFQLEDKDQVKLRLGRSPDLADALALTFALPDQPADVLGRIQKVGHVTSEWDPFEDRL